MDRLNEPIDINEERPQALCLECGADHEVEPCAPGCGEEGPMAFELRSHPRRQEIADLANEIRRQGGLLTHAEAISQALTELGLEAEAHAVRLEAQDAAAAEVISSVDAQHQALIHPDGSTCRDGCDNVPHPDGWAALDALLAKPNGDATRSADVFRLRPIDGLES
jgi:hypothetical protein